MVTDESQWYVQKGSRVQGPFTCDEVGRFLLLGRVRNSDRVSRDGELWEPVTQVPELIPEALLDLDSGQGWQRFLQARAAGEERLTLGDAPPDGERRDPSADPLARAKADWSAAGAASNAAASAARSSNKVLPWTLLGITVLALGVTVWLNASASLG